MSLVDMHSPMQVSRSGHPRPYVLTEVREDGRVTMLWVSDEHSFSVSLLFVIVEVTKHSPPTRPFRYRYVPPYPSCA